MAMGPKGGFTLHNMELNHRSHTNIPVAYFHIRNAHVSCGLFLRRDVNASVCVSVCACVCSVPLTGLPQIIICAHVHNTHTHTHTHTHTTFPDLFYRAV